MSAGVPFPPTCWQHIRDYPLDECVAGFMSYERGDPTPGENHSPGFRWGWQNRKRDSERADDGFDTLRRAYFHACPAAPALPAPRS